MSTRRSGIALLILVAFCHPTSGQERPPSSSADMCSLVQAPQKWAGQFVKVRARLVRLKSGEWAIHDTCWPPVLLSLPEELKPSPEFALHPDSDTEALRRAKSERVSLVGEFEGRVDWSGEAAGPAKTAVHKRGPFGKAKLPVRMVLRRLSDCTIIDLPYK